MEIFKLGELFCGPGGIAYGAKLASNDKFKIMHVWATDYDEDTCNTYAKNICDSERKSVICEDIRKLDLNILKNISDIDALAFGFPCNDYSVVGEKKGIHGEFGALYEYGIKVLKKFQPKWFLAENVEGLTSANDNEALSIILREMYEAGYSVYPHLYSFDNYGIPQARKRVIIIGIRKDIEVQFYPPSTKPFSNVNNSVRWALEVPPISNKAKNNEKTTHSKHVIERLNYIKPGENAFTADMPEHLKLKVKGAKISQIYKRLDPDKPSYTVTGSGGGGTHMYHWEEPRALTNRERARIQTFPDHFEFCGSKESVRKQIGMAVPSLGVKIILESLFKCFSGEFYDKIECNIRPIIYKK
ncbi:DNA cytosine methyltransferase [Bisgaard Taxon 10/6]|uniref:DNA cytosine methyltransferase n=1 Tax=Exercitatus varius TaxID=67857 RepID=UPI00294B60A8|nr:DNA cytosine methyltransferase [Exercitatus varius]MDG2916236.1 DNA cytosine methyltransferase [Exercitatus varius]